MRTTRKDRAVAGIINAQSREILCSRFRKFGSSDGSTNLVQDIQTALNNGELRYINNQSSDCKATFSSQIIPTNQ